MIFNEGEKEALGTVVAYITAALTANEEAMAGRIQSASEFNKAAIDILHEICQGEETEIFARVNYLVAFLVPMIMNYCQLTGVSINDFVQGVGYRAMRIRNEG